MQIIPGKTWVKKDSWKPWLVLAVSYDGQTLYGRDRWGVVTAGVDEVEVVEEKNSYDKKSFEGGK